MRSLVKKDSIMIFLMKRAILLVVCYFFYFIFHFYHQYYANQGLSVIHHIDDNQLEFKNIYAETFFNHTYLYPRDIIIDYQLKNCDIAKKYISTIVNVSYTKDQNILYKYRERLNQSFSTCHMVQEQIFFNQIDHKKIIKLSDRLTEKEQIKNIINYYYLIEQNSLLSEMKRMKYQSEDALLIMEKLEIDIEWDRVKKLNEEFKGIDEHFNGLIKK